MKVKRFFGKDMRQALTDITNELGADAAILSNKRLANGVEIIAAIDYDDSIISQRHQPNPDIQAVNNSGLIKNDIDPHNDHQFDLSMATLSPPVETLLSDEAEKPVPPVRLKGENKPSPNRSKKTKPSLSLVDYQVEQLKEPLDFTQSKKQANRKNGHNTVEWLPDSNVEAMRDEIENLKKLLAQQPKVRGVDLQDKLNARLASLGFEKKLSHKVVTAASTTNDENKAWELCLSLLKKRLATIQDPLNYGIYAFVGPTGAGKTTTLAKIATQYALEYGPDSLAILSTDNYRIGAYEQLKIYGRLIGCDTDVIDEQRSIEQVLSRHQEKRLVLIDSAGMSCADQIFMEQLQAIDSIQYRVRNMLVLSACSQHSALDKSYRLFSKFPLYGAIITKLDEATNLGEVLSVMINNNLPVAFLTNGLKVPDDLLPSDEALLIEKATDAMAFAQPESQAWSLEKQASGFTGNLFV